MDGQKMKYLIKKAKNGDAVSFGELYGEYAKELYRFALYTLKNTHDAEDAVQSAALLAFRKIGGLKKDESFKAWFFKILYNECRKVFSEKARSNEVLCDDIFFADAVCPDNAASSDALSLIEALPEPDRSVVVLAVLEDYTSAEIGEILSMKPETVRSRLSRILPKLRKQIEGV